MLINILLIGYCIQEIIAEREALNFAEGSGNTFLIYLVPKFLGLIFFSAEDLKQ